MFPILFQSPEEHILRVSGIRTRVRRNAMHPFEVRQFFQTPEGTPLELKAGEEKAKINAKVIRFCEIPARNCVERISLVKKCVKADEIRLQWPDQPKTLRNDQATLRQHCRIWQQRMGQDYQNTQQSC